MTSDAAIQMVSGQGWRQLGELALAFVLSSVVGLERQIRGKSAGLRTQAIVGTASALILLVSKYGFADVLVPGAVVVDPSRVAAQIVSGIGFLGAGLIVTRRGAVRGLTTAAAVWETAAIGMAAGAGLPLLAVAVTVLHFVIVLGFTPLGRFIRRHGRAERDLVVTYEDGRGVLRELMQACTARGWSVSALTISGMPEGLAADALGSDRLVTVGMTVIGKGLDQGPLFIGSIPGVVRVDAPDEDD